MRKVILDCDNTMGIKNRDIDDGLALIYLIESEDVDLIGVTCTYGNDTVDKVYNQTQDLLNYLIEGKRKYNKDNMVNHNDNIYNINNKRVNNGSIASNNDKIVNNGSISNNKVNIVHNNKDITDNNDINFDYDIEIKKGRCFYNIKETKAEDSEASRYLVNMVNKFPNQISIIATGSMQNILDAYLIDSSFFDKIDELIIMGGTTGPLFFNNKEMKELNFTVCPEGIRVILENFRKTVILTGNNCMGVEFTRRDLIYLENALKEYRNGSYKFLIEKIGSWMDDFKESYNYDAVILWDVLAAVYFNQRDLFEDDEYEVLIDDSKLEKGRLSIKKSSLKNKGRNTVILPRANPSFYNKLGQRLFLRKN